jgi:hypothetical protein
MQDSGLGGLPLIRNAARAADALAPGQGQAVRRHRRELHVSYKTVVNVSSQLKHTLDVRNLPELIRTAMQLLETGQKAKKPPA